MFAVVSLGDVGAPQTYILTGGEDGAEVLYRIDMHQLGTMHPSGSEIGDVGGQVVADFVVLCKKVSDTFV